MSKRISVLVVAISLSTGIFFAWSYFQQPVINAVHKVGDPIDSLNGVIVYYNGGVSHVGGRRLAPNGYNLGLKYQCVEFVKRYYYQHLHHQMPDSYGHAKDFFNAAIKDGQINKARALTQYSNPSASQPKINDLVIFGPTVFNPYGHVAIISDVKENTVELIQQNPGPSAPSRIHFTLIKSDNKWKIDNERILGWLRKE